MTLQTIDPLYMAARAKALGIKLTYNGMTDTQRIAFFSACVDEQRLQLAAAQSAGDAELWAKLIPLAEAAPAIEAAAVSSKTLDDGLVARFAPLPK
jgi:hypothetical protein